MFTGSIVALITPMDEDGNIDSAALENLIEWHIAAKTAAIVINGSTGEGLVLDSDEQLQTLTIAVRKANKRIPIIAGTGTNSTRSTIQNTQNAEKAGVDACLIVTPYYNKPSQNGLYQHYKMIADSTTLPIILYNVPSRTACDLQPQCIQKLAAIKSIIGIKEATGKIERALEIQELCGKDFLILSGDDATALEWMEQGTHGVISVTANIAPEKMAQMCQAALAQDFTTARKLNDELKLLHINLFVESNPIPTKWALASMGKIKNGLRLPLLPLDKQYHHKVKEAMQSAGVN